MSVTCDAQANADLEWVIGLNRLSLKICGTWRTNEKKNDWRDIPANLRILLFFVGILVFSLFPQAMALIRVWGHLLLMIDNLIASLLFVVIECELVTMWHKKEVLVTMMEYIKEDWLKPKTERERRVMLRYGKLSRIITIGGYGIIGVTVVCYHSPLLFGFVLRTLTNLTDVDSDRPFVLQTIYFFDAYRSPVYELVAISQLIICSICGFCYTTVGTLFAAIVLHVSAQLENLSERIQIMGKNSSDNHFRIEIKSNTVEHQRLIRFAESIESTFSIMLLQVVIGFTLILCIQGYQIIVILTDNIERPLIQVLFCISYMMYVVFIMCVYSVVGDILVTQSEGIQYAVYNCYWYKHDYREATQLIPILVRSQRALSISAGKFIILTLPTFATLLKTTAGYLSFLLAVREY